MIQLLPCAKCEKSLVLPLNASLKAKIKCPSCSEEFVVGDMLTSQFGVWDVVDDPTPVPKQQKQYSSTAPVLPVPGDLGDGELKLADEEPKSPPKKNVDWSDFKPITYEQYEKLKRDSRSPFWPVFQIVMGAVMAVPLSLLLIWNLLDKDVAGAGPFIARFAPWAVPEKFQGDAAEEDGDDAETSLPDDDALDPTLDNYGDGEYADEDGYGGEEAYDGEMGEEEAELAGKGLGESYSDIYERSMEEDGEPTGDVSDGLATAMTRPKDGGSPPETEKPTIEKRTRKKANRPSPSGSSGDRNVSIPTIFSSMRHSDANLDDWRVANRLKSKDLPQLTAQVYADLLELAQGINELPEGDPILTAVRTAMQPIGVDIKRYEELQIAVSEGAATQFSDSEEEEEFSVAVIVEIADVSEQRKEWELAVEDDEVVPSDLEITVPKVLAPSLNPGQRLLLLGQVVRTSEEEEDAPEISKFTACYLHAL